MYETLRDQAQNYFGITLPTTEEILKAAFRRQSFKLHPDHGGSNDEFGKMKAVYDLLMSFKGTSSTVFVDSKQAETLEVTEGGIPLHELGKGLGPTKNGVRCVGCSGCGYTQVIINKIYRCGYCHGGGTVRLCVSCKGTGLFNSQGFKKTRRCKRCSGYGLEAVDPFSWNHRGRSCPHCLGTGRVFSTEIAYRQYHLCRMCQGAGEIEVFNPVLKKGVL